MVVIAEAEKGKSRKKVHLNFQERAANCITGTQKASHGKKIFFFLMYLFGCQILVHAHGSSVASYGIFVASYGIFPCGPRTLHLWSKGSVAPHHVGS